MTDTVWKGVYPLIFGRFCQLSQNKFLIRALLLQEKVATEKKKKTGKKNGKKNREKRKEYQPSGAGGNRSPPATPHRLQKSRMAARGPKMADGIWNGAFPLGFWAF